MFWHLSKVYIKNFQVWNIPSFLEENNVVLPNGGRLTEPLATAWHSIWCGIDRVHQLVFGATNDLELFRKMMFKTLQTIEAKYSFDGNPIYVILHEPLYCQGHTPWWAAARTVGKDLRFSWTHVKGLVDTEPVYFYGEMIFPEAFDDYINLRLLKGAAEILTNDSSWPHLYDLEQLRNNEVRFTAAT
ncbi:hypothetical protein B0H10DRAFT_1938131 [Mycena sp. CBHHK59/15]|nr:hypothetical protein B0H10DRAFT_1938131 [Mycena sp. CBHHK59/15]